MLDSCGPKSGELLEPDRQAPIHVDHCQVDCQFAGVPSQLSFLLIRPASVQSHDVPKTAEFCCLGPPGNRNSWKGLADEMTPVSIASGWPLILQVKGKLVEGHVSLRRKVGNQGHGGRELCDGVHALQQDIVSLKKPGALQDAVKAVASMIIHAVHVTLSGKSLTWKSACDLKVVSALEGVGLLQC